MQIQHGQTSHLEGVEVGDDLVEIVAQVTDVQSAVLVNPPWVQPGRRNTIVNIELME